MRTEALFAIKKRILLIFAIVLVCARLLSAQIVYTQFYGKNRVIYTDFNWEFYSTKHFDIYYYTKDTKMLQIVAGLAESAYSQISDKIKHHLSAKVPLLYYKTTSDFLQSNLFQPVEGWLGVSEPVLFRVAVQGDLPIDELYDLMLHELSHIFQYDLLWGRPGGVIYAVSRPPDWVFEGFSEYCTEKWSSWSDLIVRDAVLNDRIPELNRAGEMFSQYQSIRNPAYDFGHALYDYIEAEFGKNGVLNFWHTMKNAPLIGRVNPIMKSFAMDYKHFTHEYKKHLREKYKDFVTRENPDNYGIALGPEYPMNQYWFAFSHAVSPSGDLVAVVTYNVKDFDLDVILFSVVDGRPMKNLTKGHTLKYEYIKFEIEPSNGKDITWSHDGDTIAFFARAGHKHALFLVNVLTGSIIKKIYLKEDAPSSPAFCSGDSELLYTAFEDGQRDIFKVNLDRGNTINLTRDELYEKAVTASTDGKLLAYTIRLGAFDKIFVSPADNLKKKTQLTFGRGNTITPEFSNDSQEIFFVGDMRNAYNIYSISLETGEMLRYTDVRTGCFLPVPDPIKKGKIIFTAFNKGAFQLFKSEMESLEEEAVTFADMDYDEEFERFEPIVTVDIDEKKITPYKGLGKLYMNNRPPINAILSTDGSIYGGTALSFSDLLGDYNFSLLAYQVRSFRSYNISYANLKNRFQFMAEAFQFTMFYYTPYSYLDPVYYELLSYRDALATRTMIGAQFTGFYPFNRYYRAQVGLSFINYEEDFYNPYLYQALGQQSQTYGYFYNGNALSASAALIGETTNFRYYGPYSGNTFKFSLSKSIPVNSKFIRNTTAYVDLRQYLPICGDTLFAFRLNIMASMGRNPYIYYWGGNNQVRSSYYFNIIGNTGWYANVEFRIPLVNVASTIIGRIGPVRGVFFFDMTRAKLKGYPAKIYDVGYDDWGIPILRAADAIGSYGFGIQFFFLGMPLHFDWAKRLEIEDVSKPFGIKSYGNFEFKFWIGFDF